MHGKIIKKSHNTPKEAKREGLIRFGAINTKADKLRPTVAEEFIIESVHFIKAGNYVGCYDFFILWKSYHVVSRGKKGAC